MPKQPCRQHLVAGPHGADDKPREIMGDAGSADATRNRRAVVTVTFP